ncbi:MAG TPA: hypothetical protein VFJ13_04800 [Paracoccaceae bacterium]|nr:hypothetical protein [Paracoccaceae bacterium]
MVRAESALPVDAQEELADIIEEFTGNHGLTPDMVFTAEELEHIDRIATEPFEPADPEEVKAFFARDDA